MGVLRRGKAQRGHDFHLQLERRIACMEGDCRKPVKIYPLKRILQKAGQSSKIHRLFENVGFGLFWANVLVIIPKKRDDFFTLKEGRELWIPVSRGESRIPP